MQRTRPPLGSLPTVDARRKHVKQSWRLTEMSKCACDGRLSLHDSGESHAKKPELVRDRQCLGRNCAQRMRAATNPRLQTDLGQHLMRCRRRRYETRAKRDPWFQGHVTSVMMAGWESRERDASDGVVAKWWRRYGRSQRSALRLARGQECKDSEGGRERGP